MEVIGTIVRIFETEEVGTNNFKKRPVVIKTSEQYPQELQIEFVQDKTGILDKYNEGDEVKISINLRGRKWTNPEGEDKWFNTIQGWRIVKNGDGDSQTDQGVRDDDEPPF